MNKAIIAVGTLVTATLGFAGAAFAQEDPPSVTEQVTTMATSGATQMVPVIIAVGAAFVAVAVATWGVRKVLSALRSGGRG